LAEITDLHSAVATHIRDGQSIALEGFTHLIPMAVGHEIIRQKKRNLTLIRMTPDIIYDQMIGMGCAKKMVFSWGGNPGVGSLHRLRCAIEEGSLEIEEHSHGAMANAFSAGASGMPVAFFKGYEGTSYPQINPNIRFVHCPFTGEQLTAVPAISPDVGVIHAQKADPQGNIWIDGIIGVQKEVLLASKYSIVTVEEIVPQISEKQGGIVIPSWVIDSVCVVPQGAYPSYASGYSVRDNSFYKQWDAISRDPVTFAKWMAINVLLQTQEEVSFEQSL
jgi:glutaconate CoA-transferase subunit A